ncbi:MAG: hypothetical protein R3E08_10110 [Thiotrichaceae bacterium]
MYDTKSGVIQADKGNSKEGRISVVIQPRSQKTDAEPQRNQQLNLKISQISVSFLFQRLKLHKLIEIKWRRGIYLRALMVTL